MSTTPQSPETGTACTSVVLTHFDDGKKVSIEPTQISNLGTKSHGGRPEVSYVELKSGSRIFVLESQGEIIAEVQRVRGALAHVKPKLINNGGPAFPMQEPGAIHAYAMIRAKRAEKGQSGADNVEQGMAANRTEMAEMLRKQARNGAQP